MEACVPQGIYTFLGVPVFALTSHSFQPIDSLSHSTVKAIGKR